MWLGKMDNFIAQATIAYHAIDRQHAVATMLSRPMKVMT